MVQILSPKLIHMSISTRFTTCRQIASLTRSQHTAALRAACSHAKPQGTVGYVVMAVVDGFSMMMAILLGFRYNLDDLEMRWLALPFYILLLESCCLISPCFAGFMSVESSSMVNLS